MENGKEKYIDDPLATSKIQTDEPQVNMHWFNTSGQYEASYENDPHKKQRKDANKPKPA